MTDDSRTDPPRNEVVDVTMRGVPIEEDLVWMARRGASELARATGEPGRCRVLVERTEKPSAPPVRARVSFEIAGLHAAHEWSDFDARRALARALEGLRRQLGPLLLAGST